ncbi:uncharacterized protein J3R85_015853 [Psidium guajava]|nr:uncharacterized protein J3R85_015853 [Psidium guajava]
MQLPSPHALPHKFLIFQNSIPSSLIEYPTMMVAWSSYDPQSPTEHTVPIAFELLPAHQNVDRDGLLRAHVHKVTLAKRHICESLDPCCVLCCFHCVAGPIKLMERIVIPGR